MRTLAKILKTGLVLAVAACANLEPSGPAKDKTTSITILHTNDHHGRFWQNGNGEYGMAARKTVIDASEPRWQQLAATACCSMAAM